MEIKPTHAILELMQILEILLPGALVSFAVRPFAMTHVFGAKSLLPAVESEAQGWVVFFFAAYLIGHLIFLLASFLDETVYDPVRRKWKPVEMDRAYKAASDIKCRHLQDDQGEVVNTFQWTKANLNLAYPGATSEIRRCESDSKFFRSLVLVFFGFGVFQFLLGRFFAGGAYLLLMILSFWRYFDQRWKSTQIACGYLIALEDLEMTRAARIGPTGELD
jgi:hypothetical protein